MKIRKISEAEQDCEEYDKTESRADSNSKTYGNATRRNSDDDAVYRYSTNGKRAIISYQEELFQNDSSRNQKRSRGDSIASNNK
ncbi:MAG: hypothetical protein IJZ35_04180 [Clostridia bacterium]|nr:hypothetical protein [Clostridia bacterium]